jgi:hypothetical protein
MLARTPTSAARRGLRLLAGKKNIFVVARFIINSARQISRRFSFRSSVPAGLEKDNVIFLSKY